MDDLDLLMQQFEDTGIVGEVKELIVEKENFDDFLDTFDDLEGGSDFEMPDDVKGEEARQAIEDFDIDFADLGGDIDLVDTLMEAQNDQELIDAEKELGIEEITTEVETDQSTVVLRKARVRPSSQRNNNYGDTDDILASFSAVRDTAPQGKCHLCQKDVYQSEEMVWALKRSWHAHHFCCAQCGNQLDSKDTLSFKVKNDKPYCTEDFFTLFGHKCDGCNDTIRVPQYHHINDSFYHLSCLRCSTKNCGQLLTTENYYEDKKSHKFLCQQHFLKSEGRLCGACDKEITGNFIGGGEHKYHPDHYKCVQCKTHLSGQVVNMEGKDLYCIKCFEIKDK